MKKIALVGLLTGLSLVMGCQDKKTPPPPAQSAELTPATPAPYIPPSAGAPVTVTPMESSAPLMTTPMESTPAPRKSAAKSSSESSKSMVSGSVRPGSTYVVKSGDSLGKIAVKAYGSKNSKKHIEAIKKANGLKSDVIRVGQKLKIPVLSSAKK